RVPGVERQEYPHLMPSSEVPALRGQLITDGANSTSTLGGLVYALPHLLPGSKKREALLPNLDQCSSLGVTGGPSRPGLDPKGTKAPQLNAVTPGHCSRNLFYDDVDDFFHVALVKVRARQGNALH